MNNNDLEKASALALSFLGPQKEGMEPSVYFDKYQKLTKTFLALIKEQRPKNHSLLDNL